MTGAIPRMGLALAAITLALHLLGNPHYGFFRDELYFIVCGRHPAWGYVDQPPIAPLLAAGSQLFGTSLFAIRAIPALLAAATVATGCTLVRDMGGGRFAMVVAAIGVALAPVLTTFGTLLGPDSVQVPLWCLAVLAIGRALDGPGSTAPRWWLVAGAALGLAAEAKYTTLFAAAALFAGLLATSRRRAMLSPWPWAGAALATLILLPNALWQVGHGLPMLELLRNGQHGKNVVLGPGEFLLQQVLLTHPLLAPIWIAGFVWCLFRAQWRWLGAAFCVLLAIMIVLHGKAYYPAAIYPALFAPGAVALEAWMNRRIILQGALASLLLLAGAALAPLGMPFLPEPAMVAYTAALAGIGIGVPAIEHHRQPALGQIYADMHGWPELAAQVTALYRALPEETRRHTAILAQNYGEAAAIDVLAPAGALPPVLSGHNQYWLWGPRGWDGSAVLDIGGDLADDKAQCDSATVLATTGAPYIMPYEDGRSIILCRNLRQRVTTLWPLLRTYE